MTNTIKFSQFPSASLSDPTTLFAGLASGVNITLAKQSSWTVSTRPVPPFNGLLGFNTDLQEYEYWDSVASAWIQLASAVDLTATFITKTPELALPDSFALSTLTTGILKSQTGTGNLSISAPLTSIDSLATLANEIIYTTAADTYAVTTLTPFSRSLLALANAGAWETALNIPSIPVPVTQGGTGNTGFTAFSLIAAGTLPTGPFQNVASTGTPGQVLVSQGPGGLPQWTTIASTGIVNPGTINDLGYYASSGTVISPLATLANGTLVTDSGGVPSISQTLPLVVQSSITELGTIISGVWNGTPVDVPHGGSGNTSFTAFSVICGGTTATGNMQNVSGVGLSGQVLTSQGPGILPHWANATGTGTVNSGLQNQIAWYATNGNIVSGLATATNGLLVTGNTGTPVILAGPGTSGNILQSNSISAPSFSTATYPSIATSAGTILRANGANWLPSTSTFADTYAINNILYASATNTVTGLVSGNNGVLISGTTGIPSWLPNSGTAGFVLTANSAAPPSWQVPPGAGTVLITDDNSTNAVMFPVWVTANSGSLPLKVSSTELSWTPATATLKVTGSINGLTGKISAPTAIADSAGANVLSFSYTPGSVAYLELRNNSPGFSAIGTNPNVNITLNPKAGNIVLYDNTATTAPGILFYNSAITHFTNIHADPLATSDLTLQWPSVAPAVNGAAMVSTTLGVLSFSANPVITQVNVQTITATGVFTYTPTTGTRYAIFELQAGGGGSGGAGGAASQGAVGGGGSGGAYMKILVSGTANLAAVTGSVGGAGAAGAAGNNTGGNGGNTTLTINAGSIWTAGAGSGGAGQAAAATSQASLGLAGGTNITGTNGTLLVSIVGGYSSVGLIGASAAFPQLGSAGGAAFLGNPACSNIIARAGNNYGGGAAGGSNNTGANIAGAAGGQGIVIVTEFISA